MAQSKKMSRKELKEPDEFVVTMIKVADFLKAYGGWLVVGILLLVIAIVGGVMLSRQSEISKIEKASALTRVISPVLSIQSQKTPKSEDETRVDYNKTVEEIEKFEVENQASPLGKVATLAKAMALVKAGKHESAVDEYRKLLGGDEGRGSFSFILWEALGNALDSTLKREEAEKAFEEMTKADSKVIKAFGYLHIGDLYNPMMQMKDEKGDANKAKEAYEKGLKEVAGEESEMGQTQLLVKKSLEKRLALLE